MAGSDARVAPTQARIRACFLKQIVFGIREAPLRNASLKMPWGMGRGNNDFASNHGNFHAIMKDHIASAVSALSNDADRQKDVRPDALFSGGNDQAQILLSCQLIELWLEQFLELAAKVA